MKFLCIYKPGKPEGTPPSQEMIGKMGKLIEEGFRSRLAARHGRLPSQRPWRTCTPLWGKHYRHRWPLHGIKRDHRWIRIDPRRFEAGSDRTDEALSGRRR